MIILIIGVTSWPGTARVVRSQTLRVRELQFIERAGDRLQDATSCQARLAQRVPADLRQHRAGGGHRHPLGDDAVVPRPRRPAQLQLGRHAAQRLGTGAAGVPAWRYLLPPGIAIVLVVSRSPSSARRSTRCSTPSCASARTAAAARRRSPSAMALTAGIDGASSVATIADGGSGRSRKRLREPSDPTTGAEPR